MVQSVKSRIKSLKTNLLLLRSLFSPPTKEAVIENSGILQVNEANHPVGFLSNLNGKSLAWNFEEIIDLGVIPKTTRQSSDSIAAEMSNQNLNDTTAVPPSPKLVFEEDSTMNSLTKPIETASGNLCFLEGLSD